MLNQEMKDLTLNLLSLAKKGLETKIHIFSKCQKKLLYHIMKELKNPVSFKKYS